MKYEFDDPSKKRGEFFMFHNLWLARDADYILIISPESQV